MALKRSESEDEGRGRAKTQIPVLASRFSIERWKSRLEESESKTNQLINHLAQRDRIATGKNGNDQDKIGTFFKVETEHKRLKRKTVDAQMGDRDLHIVEKENEELLKKNALLVQIKEKTVKQAEDRENELALLRKLAEAMFKEYDQLKNKYDLDTGALNQAVQRASKWYKENRELKRKSTALMQRVLEVAPGSLAGLEDETDTGPDTEEIDTFRKNTEILNGEIARLQCELNCAKLLEFEAQEQAVEMQAALEEERQASNRLRTQVAELSSAKDNLGEVSKRMAAEVSNLEHCLKGRESTEEIGAGDAWAEVLRLGSQLEEERKSWKEERETLKEELKKVREELARLHKERNSLRIRVGELESGLVVPPPPPPPPPLPVENVGPSKGCESATLEVASLLGLKRTPRPAPQPGVIDEIINQIKGGRFTLKTPEKPKVERVEERPAAVEEMMAVLGTLRRRPGNRRPSFRSAARPELSPSADIAI